MLRRTLVPALFLIAVAAVSPARSQTPAAAPPSAAATAAPVAPHACTKPEFPGKDVPHTRLRKWQTDFRAYLDCVKAYVGDRNAAIEAQSKAARAAVEEINAAVADYNETVKTFAN